MAATPFTITVVLKPRNRGPPITLTGTCSDVANALVTWAETGTTSTFVVPAWTGGVDVDDIQGSAAGVDTTRLQFVVDTVDKPIRLRSALLANLTTSKESRVPRGVALGPTAAFQMRQLA